MTRVNRFAIVISLAVVGCADGDPVPSIMTIEELALAYEETVGERVILEGRLRKGSGGRYFLVQRPSDIAGSNVADFQLQLRFTSDNVDEDQMDNCIDGTTLVTGYVEALNRIRVEYVKLKTDALIHAANDCYVYYQVIE